jgi:hypothetical protein
LNACRRIGLELNKLGTRKGASLYLPIAREDATIVTDDALFDDVSFAESRASRHWCQAGPLGSAARLSSSCGNPHAGRVHSKKATLVDSYRAIPVEFVESFSKALTSRACAISMPWVNGQSGHRPSARLPLTPPLRRDNFGMTQANNAGIKRNRRPAGVKVVERKIVLAAETEARLKAAGMASGSLSLSRYLELLVGQLESQYGALPVLSPILDGTEVPAKKAT